MTLEELILQLEELEDAHGGDLEVFVSIDPEGNGFPQLACAEFSHTRDGEPCHRNDSDNGNGCVVLWP